MNQTSNAAMGIWTVYLSGPSARGIQPAPTEYTITTNAGGFNLDEPPTHYFLTDSVACERYNELARNLRAKYRTRLISLHRQPSALATRNVADFDDLLFVRPQNDGRFCPGAFSQSPYSGGYCLQYAVNCGATDVHVYGLDGGLGYQSPVYAQLIQSIVYHSPGTVFHFHCTPDFPLAGINVRRVRADESGVHGPSKGIRAESRIGA